jgi:glycosyltransferase involved in cell wall biosynthesis
LAEQFEINHGIKPVAVVMPGLEVNDFSGKKPETHRDIDILGVGSFISLKKYQVFINIVARVVVKFPDIKVVLAGSGPLEKNLRLQAREAGLEKTILFPGSIPHHEVLDLMRRSKILLHPSNYEGFSGVCQEARAAGATVLSVTKPMQYDFPGWVQVRSEDELVEACSRYLSGSANTEPALLIQSIEETVEQVLKALELV